MDDYTALQLANLIVEYYKHYGDASAPPTELTVAELYRDIKESLPANYADRLTPMPV